MPDRVVSQQVLARIPALKPRDLLVPIWKMPWDFTQTIRVSPDSRHVAYVLLDHGQWTVSRDGTREKPYAGIANSPFLFSPDSRRFGYAVKLDQGQAFVVDGVETLPCTEALGLSFSPDGNRVAYAVKRGSRSLWIVDGREGAFFDALVDNFTFSPDGQHYAYAATQGTNDVLVRDGQELRKCDFIDDIQFSPDSQRLLYVTGVGKSPHHPHLQSVPGDWFWGDPPRYSRVYQATCQRLEVDGHEEGEVYEVVGQPVFSPDNRRTAFLARQGKSWFVVLDGKRQASFDDFLTRPVTFSPDSQRVAYVALRGKQWFTVIDGREMPCEEILKGPVFSPNSQRVAYVVRDEKSCWAVIDGQRGRKCFAGRHFFDFPANQPMTLTFSPDSQHVVYWAYENPFKAVTVVDGMGRQITSLVLGRIVFDSVDQFHYLTLQGGKDEWCISRVEERLP